MRKYSLPSNPNQIFLYRILHNIASHIFRSAVPSIRISLVSLYVSNENELRVAPLVHGKQLIPNAYLDVANFAPGDADRSSRIYGIVHHLLADPDL